MSIKRPNARSSSLRAGPINRRARMASKQTARSGNSRRKTFRVSVAQVSSTGIYLRTGIIICRWQKALSPRPVMYRRWVIAVKIEPREEPMSDPSPVLLGSSHGPLVTIAIPTFNRASWLRACVAAALAQSYENFEVVVSDNASTDDTPAVLAEFDDDHLRMLRQQTNIGPIANWNACLAAARGDYVVFVSDDDRISPLLVERCAALIKREPDMPLSLALGDVYWAAEGRTRPAVASRKLTTGIWDGTDVLQEFLKDQISPHDCTVLIRTEVLRVRGGFPSGWPHLGDLASWLPLMMTGRVGFVNEPCGTYCVHDATQTSRFSIDIRLTDLRKLVDLIRSTARQTVEDERTRRDIELDAGRYLARNAIGMISERRRVGSKLTDLLPVIWQRRRDFRGVGLGDAFALARTRFGAFTSRAVDPGDPPGHAVA